MKEIDPYRELFEKSSDAILIIEGDKFVDCNQATVQMLEYKNKAQVLSTHPSELSPPFQPDGRSSFEKANAMISIAFQQGSHRFEWEHKRANGEVFPVEVLLTAVKEEGRRVLHVVWRDISDRKRLEENLRHSQKLEAIGKLAGGIAHDFNNLLVAVLGYSDLLMHYLSGDSKAIEFVSKIKESGDRAAVLVNQLLAFARKQPHSVAVVDVRDAVKTVVELTAPIVGEEITVTSDIPDNPICVEVDQGHLEQALMNLVTNSRDAMPRGGEIQITVLRTQLPNDYPIAAELSPGTYVDISVTDTGKGMSEKIMNQSFDPFFTTKEMGRGTGLGLSTVFGIATQYGGTATIESKAGNGTTVRLLIPTTDKKPREELPNKDYELVPGGTETVLVAEDDPAVFSFVKSVLENAGYHVRSARDGKEALRALDEDDAIGLLLSDVIMPGMRGPDLVRTLRSQGRCPPVLFISGYADDELEDLAQNQNGISFLPKPFSGSQLLVQVRNAIDKHS